MQSLAEPLSTSLLMAGEHTCHAPEASPGTVSGAVKSGLRAAAQALSWLEPASADLAPQGLASLDELSKPRYHRNAKHDQVFGAVVHAAGCCLWLVSQPLSTVRWYALYRHIQLLDLFDLHRKFTMPYFLTLSHNPRGCEATGAKPLSYLNEVLITVLCMT